MHLILCIRCKVEVKIQKSKEHLEFLEINVPQSSHPALTHPARPCRHLPAKQCKTVLTAVDELRKQGFNITDEHITTALKQVKTLTGLHGRWEVK
jgi:dihydrofolate synthase/folylpolyglutamate synthase